MERVFKEQVTDENGNKVTALDGERHSERHHFTTKERMEVTVGSKSGTVNCIDGSTHSISWEEANKIVNNYPISKEGSAKKVIGTEESPGGLIDRFTNWMDGIKPRSTSQEYSAEPKSPNLTPTTVCREKGGKGR